MIKKSILVAAIGVLTIFSGCGSNDAPGIAGTAAVLMGASTTPGRVGAVKRPAGRCTSPGNGHWRLSPNQAKVTLKKVSFFIEGSVSPLDTNLADCLVTYDRGKPSGVSLQSCAISIPAGKIVRLMVYYSTTFQVQITDDNNCIYTDPGQASGFTTVKPATPQFSTFTVTGQSGDFVSDSFLPAPFEVKVGDTPKLNIVADMIHAVFADAASGVMTFNASLPSPPVYLFATFSDSGKSEFYTPSGDAENLNTGVSTSESYVRVFYLASGQPGFVSHDYLQCNIGNFPTMAWNTSPLVSPVADYDKGFRAGGYLGLDGTNTLAWATPTDFTYGAYKQLISMPRAAAIMRSVTLSCKLLHDGAAPAPISGDTYSSGAPAISSPDGTFTEKLAAN